MLSLIEKYLDLSIYREVLTILITITTIAIVIVLTKKIITIIRITQ